MTAEFNYGLFLNDKVWTIHYK